MDCNHPKISDETKQGGGAYIYMPLKMCYVIFWGKKQPKKMVQVGETLIERLS